MQNISKEAAYALGQKIALDLFDVDARTFAKMAGALSSIATAAGLPALLGAAGGALIPVEDSHLRGALRGAGIGAGVGLGSYLGVKATDALQTALARSAKSNVLRSIAGASALPVFTGALGAVGGGLAGDVGGLSAGHLVSGD